MPHLSYVGTLVKQADNDRYLCSLFAPELQREGLFALYAFNSEIARIRETVSDPMLGFIRLQWWREAIESLYKGGSPRQHKIITSLQAANQRSPLSQALFDTIITAREADLDEQPPATVDALLSYATNTSSALFKLALEALEVHHEAAHSAAHHLGLAWALTGYVRGFRFDAATNRIMLPQELLDRHQLTKEDILAGYHPERTLLILRQLGALAEEHLAITYRYRHEIPASALPVFLHATLATSYLNRLRKLGYDSISHEITPSRITLQLRLFVNALREKF
jgi:NADH dehydrogenase [ubiquinone] 1 alpha subcomplex assembly factor 6